VGSLGRERRPSVPGLAQVRRLQGAVRAGHVGRRGAPAGGFEVAQLQPVFGEAAQIGLSDRSKRWWRRLAGRMTSGSSDLPATIATNEALGQISSASSRAR